MLENQQLQLVHGIQELYRRLKNGEGWSGAPLKEINGTPLTHDLLERLGALKQEGQAESAQFEDDFGTLQSRLLANGAGFMKREMSFDASSEGDLSPMFEPAVQYKPAFTNPFNNHFPPTPPMNSPHPLTIKTSSPLKTQMNTSTPSSIPDFLQESPWQPDPLNIAGMDCNMTYEPSAFDTNMQAMFLAEQTSAQTYQRRTDLAVNPCMTMKSWDEPYDNTQQYFQGGIFT